jgi:hypothetical protein
MIYVVILQSRIMFCPAVASKLIDSVVCCLLAGFGLVEEGAVQVFHYYAVRLSYSFLMYNFKSFQGK